MSLAANVRRSVWRVLPGSDGFISLLDRRQIWQYANEFANAVRGMFRHRAPLFRSARFTVRKLTEGAQVYSIVELDAIRVGAPIDGFGPAHISGPPDPPIPLDEMSQEFAANWAKFLHWWHVTNPEETVASFNIVELMPFGGWV